MNVKSLKKTNCALFSLLAMLAPALVWASIGMKEPGGRREPPKEAIDACREKSGGDVVEVTTKNGQTIKATCRQIDEKLASMPDRESPPFGSGG